MRRSDYFDRYDRITRLSKSNTLQDLEDAELDRKWRKMQFETDIVIVCALLLLCMGVIAATMTYIRHRDRIAVKGFVAVAPVNPCERCHSFYRQHPPTLDTYKKYARHYPSPAEQRALLAELERP